MAELPSRAQRTIAPSNMVIGERYRAVWWFGELCGTVVRVEPRGFFSGWDNVVLRDVVYGDGFRGRPDVRNGELTVCFTSGPVWFRLAQ